MSLSDSVCQQLLNPRSRQLRRGAPVDVYMYSLDDFHIRGLPSFSGILLDDLDVCR